MVAPADDLSSFLTPVVELASSGRVLYALQPKQLECYLHTPLAKRADEPYPANIGYGGAAGGGKSYVSRAILTGVAFSWPGSCSIIFRRTEGEVKENHILKFRGEVPEVVDGIRLYSWNGDDLCATWWNGSRTYFGYLKTDDDVFRYQGNEYDCMIFEESTHYSSFQVRWLVGNRLRASVSGSRPFCVFPSNPGSKGHMWYKRLFIDRNYHEDDGESEDDYVFVQAKLSDNKVLTTRDKVYAKRLDQLPEPWRSWQRDGNFAAGAGAMLSELNRDVHFVQPFTVPDHWPRYGAFDWGYAHPWVFGEYAVSEDGIAVKIQTIKGMRQLPPAICGTIREKVQIERLSAIYAGHDTWAKVTARGDDTPSIADQMEEFGFTLTPARINRVQGLQSLKRMLSWKEADGTEHEPRLVFMHNQGNESCVKTLEAMVPDPDNLEDVLKVNADELGRGGDDEYDETRYFAASRSAAADEWTGGVSPSAWDPIVLAHEAAKRRHHDDDVLVDPDRFAMYDPVIGEV